MLVPIELEKAFEPLGLSGGVKLGKYESVVVPDKP